VGACGVSVSHFRGRMPRILCFAIAACFLNSALSIPQTPLVPHAGTRASVSSSKRTDRLTMAPDFPRIPTLTIAGTGLLGGSIALGARARAMVDRIIAVGRPLGSHHEAAAAGIVDEALDDLEVAIAQADFVILCTPVERIVADLPVVVACAKPGAVITDVGSTKAEIVRAANAHPSKAHFVGSHPMAGSEKTGWRHASSDLFVDAPALITPDNKTNSDAAARCAALWSALGARPQFLGPQRHDEMVALVSHAPHFVAVALAESLRRTGEDAGLLARLSATGLRDTTRVAMGSPEMWLPIARHNAQAVADALDDAGVVLAEIATAIREKDEERLATLLADARALRMALQKGA